jgi:hypothetical protein
MFFNKTHDIGITQMQHVIKMNFHRGTHLQVSRIANQAFAVLAMCAGMDSFILDPLNKDMMGMLFATEAMMGEDEYGMEYIGAFREAILHHDDWGSQISSFISPDMFEEFFVELNVKNTDAL